LPGSHKAFVRDSRYDSTDLHNLPLVIHMECNKRPETG
jgi:hypothetical protein